VVERHDLQGGHGGVKHTGDQPVGLAAAGVAGGDRDLGSDHPDLDPPDPGRIRSVTASARPRRVAALTCFSEQALAGLGRFPSRSVHLDAGYDSSKTRTRLPGRGRHGEIAHKGEKAPIQASPRWHVERTKA
jgi:hypothetical protein